MKRKFHTFAVFFIVKKDGKMPKKSYFSCAEAVDDKINKLTKKFTLLYILLTIFFVLLVALIHTELSNQVDYKYTSFTKILEQLNNVKIEKNVVYPR